MVFHSIAFINFFIIVYGVGLFLPLISTSNQHYLYLKDRLYKLFLLGASYYFYGYWDYRFLSLIVISTTIDYWAGHKIFNTPFQNKRKTFLAISIISNLSILGFFKYYNFFMDSAGVFLISWGLALSHLDIVLPLGISFYTFQSMSYSLDIYFKRIKPVNSIANFALYVAFFPQLVAGPIVRASYFLPQLLRPINLTVENLFNGFQIFLFGMFLKVVLADNIAIVVDPIFFNPQNYGSIMVWIGVIGYSIQIFCDFFGYSEMAIGLALIMGFYLPINFRTPYLATNLNDFWRRWHISLSSWLRDYLYIPLGGNRKGPLRTSIAVLITFSLGGLWHGADWRFVLWGLFHAFGLLAINNLRLLQFNFLHNFFKWLITYVFVCFGWVLFRSENLEIAKTIYLKLLFIHESIGSKIIAPETLFIIPCIILIHIWLSRVKEDAVYFKLGSPTFYLYTTFMMYSVILFAPLQPKNFIYFQF